ncbi:MAG: hypothetical protein QOE41_79, partial [Mycobacterium sp.]|nr:hypothetical protein [Mycobacterium sp.]
MALAADLPAAIIADLLGMHIATAILTTKCWSSSAGFTQLSHHGYGVEVEFRRNLLSAR